MADNSLHESSLKSERSFPMVIAITALILAITSGVVNYRQNNLTNLESSLRDTRDQLQLAKNDITDIKVKTIKQLVDAEFAVKNHQQVKNENSRLSKELAEAKVRLTELEEQIRKMDHKLVSAKASLKAARKKRVATKVKTKKATSSDLAGLIATSDLDIFTQKIAPSLQQSIDDAISRDGFKAKFPPRPAGMGLSRETTVFYYNANHKAVAEKLVKSLASITRGSVALRKGASPYPDNKIIVHIIGD